jgi:hypothetical protein
MPSPKTHARPTSFIGGPSPVYDTYRNNHFDIPPERLR